MSAFGDGIHARFALRYPGADGFSLDVDTHFAAGGISAIFGRSGSGKSTLLRCIAGLQKAQGHLTVNGDVWQGESSFLPTHKRPLGFVFQESSLFPHLTAAGNLQYAMRRADGKPAPDLLDHVLDLMGLRPLLDRHPGQLSGGERQRVAIARALLINPRLLLMDEPLASLDTARKQEILPYLERLRTDFDIPILYVTHSVDELARLADRVLVLEEGRVATQGALADVMARVDLPVRLLEETGVVLAGRITARDEQWHLARFSFSGGELWVPESGHGDTEESGPGDSKKEEQVRVRVSARDVSLALSAHEDTSILNRVRAEIIDISPDADAAMALVRLQCASDILIARLTCRSVEHLQIKPGMSVWAQVKSVAVIR